MKIDRRIIARLPGQHDHALAFAETIDAEQMGALGIGRKRSDQPQGFLLRRLVPEHRQAECRLGDEEIAWDEFERPAGRIGTALVVARHDHARALPVEHHLAGAENMPGGDTATRRRR